MKKDIARHVAKEVFGCMSDLTDIVSFIKEFSDSSEDARSYGLAIAAIGAEASDKVLNKIFMEHPDIKEEFDKELKIYGKLL